MQMENNTAEELMAEVVRVTIVHEYYADLLDKVQDSMKETENL